MVEKESSCQIQCLIIDRDGEFSSTTFNNFCSTHCIKRQLTTTYTPEQNEYTPEQNDYNEYADGSKVYPPTEDMFAMRWVFHVNIWDVVFIFFTPFIIVSVSLGGVG